MISDQDFQALLDGTEATFIASLVSDNERSKPQETSPNAGDSHLLVSDNEVSNKVFTPTGENKEEIAKRKLRDAESMRLRKVCYGKNRFPIPRALSSYEYNHKVLSFIETYGLRYMNAKHLEYVSQEELTEELASVIAGSKYRNLLEEHTWSIAEAGAERVFDIWDRDYIAKRTVKGRAGGMKSKRPKEFDEKELLSMKGLDQATQARILGCSIPTIARMRKALREQGHTDI